MLGTVARAAHLPAHLMQLPVPCVSSEMTQHDENLRHPQNYLLTLPVVEQQAAMLPRYSCQMHSPSWRSQGQRGLVQSLAATGWASQCLQAHY